jgi:hypothetical protein
LPIDDDKKLDYARDWFEYHAGQRLTAFNFFLILIGLVVVGFLKCIELAGKSQPTMEQAGMGKVWWTLAIVIGLFGIIISIAFWFLDIRNEELVNYGRNALELLEASNGISIRLSDKTRSEIDKSSDFISRQIPRSCREILATHHFWLRFIILFTALVFALATMFSAIFAYRNIVC